MSEGLKPSDEQAGPRDIKDQPSSFIPGLVHKGSALMDRMIPAELSADPERSRRARLASRFGFLGAVFGSAYAIFYLFIGHNWGAAIVLMCSSAFAIAPFVMRWRKSIEPAGHFLCFTLAAGFTALCFVEGGLRGHAIAWLVSVPLCALLLLGQKPATCWTIVAALAAGLVAGLDLAGIRLPFGYDDRWHFIVSAAGYLGLILFMFFLGLIFESGRARAFARMQDALTKLAASNERLVHLNNEKNEFLGIAAHDLKNPLTVVAGSAELVGMTKDYTLISKLAKNIVGAATRMHNLITDLLDANAIEQGKLTSNIERCDLGALVAQSVEQNQTAAVKKQITFRVAAPGGLWARADQKATSQILDNLISNALKYSRPDTTVHVNSVSERDNIVVSVRDEGPGISEADQKKLFQKFTRLSARPTGGESSTGLGLSIVKRLAEAMGGSVQCQSALGSGATFLLRLPVWANATSMPTDSPVVNRGVTVSPVNLRLS